jgi:hypothetical protein
MALYGVYAMYFVALADAEIRESNENLPKSRLYH